MMAVHFLTMVSPAFLSLVLLAAVFPGHGSCALWSASPQDGAEVYVCSQSTLFLPWTLLLADGDNIADVKWFYSGRSEEMVAFLVADQFVPTASYSGRVHLTTNTGITIVQLDTMDSGNYSVQVIVRTAGGDTVTLDRSASVHVSDGVHTTDGQLHVLQQPLAERNETTDQADVVLTCGTFMFTTQPPFDVTWLTPSGRTLPSSSYEDGKFLLTLPSPLEWGSYICRVPSTDTCDHRSAREAALSLDRTEVLLAMLERRNKELRNRLERLNTNAVTPAAACCTKKQVSFHARLDNSVYTQTGSHIVLPDVVTNQGQAYDPSSGTFTAPFDGTYCFMASTRSRSDQYEASMLLMVASARVDYLFAPRGGDEFESGSVHAVVHLREGQHVWLKALGESYFAGRSTVFSGFLVSSDM